MLSHSGLTTFSAAACVDGSTAASAWSTGSASVGAYLLIDLGAAPAFPQLIVLSPFGTLDNGTRDGHGHLTSPPAATCLYALEYSDNLSTWTTVANMGWLDPQADATHFNVADLDPKWWAFFYNDQFPAPPAAFDPTWLLADCWAPATFITNPPVGAGFPSSFWPAGTYGAGDGSNHRYWRLRLSAISGGGIPFSELALFTLS